MQKRVNFKCVIALLFVVVAALTPQKAKSQRGEGSSLVFSPYTMYGIGDMITQGTASQMAMGGVGVSWRPRYEINYLNPASLSEIPQRCALFSFGARANNTYSKSEYTSSAYSSVDFSDLGFAVPIARGIGMSFSLQPVTSVGYGSSMLGTSPSVSQDIGKVLYQYWGEGGISQLSAGLGVMVFKGFSLGANYIYYFGTIDRYNTAMIVPLIEQNVIYNTVGTTSTQYVAQSLFNLGAQYSVRVGKKSEINIGATYQPRIKTKVDTKDLMTSTSTLITDTISFSRYDFRMAVPEKFAFGISFDQRDKLFIAFDYSYQNWANSFEVPLEAGISLSAQQSYKVGASYTPDKYSIKSAMNRWSYKVGAHYTTSYLVKNGEKLDDFGISLGVDIPLKRYSLSKITAALDFGARGSTKPGQVKESYFKVYVGVSLFGDDRWFVRSKFH